MVMIWLFRQDLSSKQKIKTVGELAVEHTTNLAAFAALYKVIVIPFFNTLSTIHGLNRFTFSLISSVNNFGDSKVGIMMIANQ